METFETVNKASLVNSRGVKYFAFKSTLNPHYWKVWLHIFMGYLALMAVLAGVMWLQKTYASYFWLTIPAGGLFIGYWVAYINLFMHEAAHYNIAADRRQNDLIANIFIGLLLLIL